MLCCITATIRQPTTSIDDCDNQHANEDGDDGDDNDDDDDDDDADDDDDDDGADDNDDDDASTRMMMTIIPMQRKAVGGPGSPPHYKCHITALCIV